MTCSSKIFCKNYHYKLQIKQMKFEKWADLAGITGRLIDDFRQLRPKDAAPSVYQGASAQSPLLVHLRATALVFTNTPRSAWMLCKQFAKKFLLSSISHFLTVFLVIFQFLQHFHYWQLLLSTDELQKPRVDCTCNSSLALAQKCGILDRW